MKFIDLSKVLKTDDIINDITRGKKLISSILHSSNYPIRMSDRSTYTKDGKYNIDDKYPSLYRNEPQLQIEYEPELEIDFSKLPRDTMVFTGDNEIDMSKPKYFSDFLPNGSCPFNVYMQGKNNKNATDTIGFKKCILHPSVEIKREWLK